MSGYELEPWHAAIPGAGGALTIFYHFYRKWKEDKREDRNADELADAHSGVIDRMETEIKRITERLESEIKRAADYQAQQNEWLDRAYQERNDALIACAKLEGKLDAVQAKYERDMIQLQIEIEDLKVEIRKVEAERDAERERAQKLEEARNDPHAPRRRATDPVSVTIDDRDIRKI